MSDPSLLSPEYNGNKLLTFTAVFIPVQIIAVALRYLARYLVEGPWGLDDVLVLTSLSLQMCMAGLSIESVHNGGVGYHVPYLEETNPQVIRACRKYVFAITVLYFGTVNLPKIAILALYHRVFPNKNIRLGVWIILGTLVGFTISTVITALAECRPFAADWNPEFPGAYCINKLAFYRYGSIPNILTDIAMLILPMKVLLNLQVSTRLKIALIATFAVGSVGLGTSIVRLAIFFVASNPDDGTWSAVEFIIWTQVETGVYLISACLMTYRPLLERIGKGRYAGNFMRHSKRSNDHYVGSKSTRQDTPDIPLRSRTEDDNHGFRRLENDDSPDARITVTTKISVGQKKRSAEQDLECGGSI